MHGLVFVKDCLGWRCQFLGCRAYREEHCALLERERASGQYVSFGWLAAISFPFLWAPSFGEFGSVQWRHWGTEFKDAGVPVRSCVVHSLDLLSGV